MHFRGKLYRALNPIYSREPLSAIGAKKYGGRFNPKGTAALNVATSFQTAIREANQVGDLQPTMIVSYHGDFENIFDSRDRSELGGFGMTPSDLADPRWRDQMRIDAKAKAQAFAENLIAEGFAGLLVRSFARGATDDDLNLVLWNWSDALPNRITLIDYDGRLTKI